MQEEVENRTVNLAISTTKLTGRTNTGVPDPQPESPRHGRRQSPKEEEAPCPCKWVSSYLQPPFGMSAANLIRNSVNDFALRR